MREIHQTVVIGGEEWLGGHCQCLAINKYGNCGNDRTLAGFTSLGETYTVEINKRFIACSFHHEIYTMLACESLYGRNCHLIGLCLLGSIGRYIYNSYFLTIPC